MSPKWDGSVFLQTHLQGIYSDRLPIMEVTIMSFSYQKLWPGLKHQVCIEKGRDSSNSFVTS